MLLSLAIAGPCCAADIYKCADAGGSVTYTNTPSAGCRKLEPSDRVSTVPGDPAVKGRPSGGAASAKAPPAGDSRRAGLEQQLAEAEQQLAQARQALQEQEAIRSGDENNYQRVLERLQPYKDKVTEHEQAVAAVKRQLSELR